MNSVFSVKVVFLSPTLSVMSLIVVLFLRKSLANTSERLFVCGNVYSERDAKGKIP